MAVLPTTYDIPHCLASHHWWDFMEVPVLHGCGLLFLVR